MLLRKPWQSPTSLYGALNSPPPLFLASLQYLSVLELAFRPAWYIPEEKNTPEGGKSNTSHTQQPQRMLPEYNGVFRGSDSSGEDGQSYKRIRFQQAMRSLQWLVLLGQIVTSCWLIKISIHLSKYVELRKQTGNNIFQLWICWSIQLRWLDR